MADSTQNPYPITEYQPMSTPPNSTPLQLSGFLSGDTIQVRGDTNDLQFSVQFNVNRKTQPATDFDTVGLVQSSSSSYLTPVSSHVSDEDQNGAGEGEEVSGLGSKDSKRGVLTRLRSGVLSPVNYDIAAVRYGGGLSSESRMKKGVKGRGNGNGKGDAGNVFDKMLKRRSLPVRPCSSYAFFVMANWSEVKGSSFQETSKRLSGEWRRLPHHVKKMYEDMASKDSARYKRQSFLLMNDDSEKH